MVGGGSGGCCSGHTCTLRPRRWKEESAVVGVLVHVGVSPPGLSCLGGWVRIRAGGHLF